nr:hypothetical protein [Pandoravirus massiliensis]
MDANNDSNCGAVDLPMATTTTTTTHPEQPECVSAGDDAVAMDIGKGVQECGSDRAGVDKQGVGQDALSTTSPATESSDGFGGSDTAQVARRPSAAIFEAYGPRSSGIFMPYDMSHEALDRMLRSTIDSIGPLYPDDDNDNDDNGDGHHQDGQDYRGDGGRDDCDFDRQRDYYYEGHGHTGSPEDDTNDAPYTHDHQPQRSHTEKTANRERPPLEDEPLPKRRQVEEQIDAPPRPRRGRPPGRTSGPRSQTQTRLTLSTLRKRFVRESADGAGREVCEVRLVGVRHNAMDRQEDGHRHVDHNGVRLSTADDGALPPALSFRRILDAEAESRIYTCVGAHCGARFACANQNALIACGPERHRAPSGHDENNNNSNNINDEEVPDDQDIDTLIDPAMDGIPVDGFVCPLHGARHAYCASCLIAHMELDLPIDDTGDDDDDDNNRHTLEGRWPVRCPGFTSVWLTQPPPPVGARSLPRGGSAAATDPSVIASSAIARCPFVLGPRFVRALVERCRPDAIQRAFGVTFGMACEAVADDPDIATVVEDDDIERVDVYNTLPPLARDGTEGGSGGDDHPEDDDDTNSDRHRALRLTRQKGLSRLRAMAEAEYTRRATATNPQYWIATCPYGGCNATVHLDRMFAFNMVCLVCQACKRCYCSGCGETLVNDGSPEDAALRRHHEVGCYTYKHAPWFDKDVGFLERVLRDPATTAAVDPARTSRTDGGGASQASRPRTVIEILLDAGGSVAVRRAIAARIAECFIHADCNGSTQRCPTCHRRTNMNEARAPTREATVAALARAHASRNLGAARSHAHRLASVYSTLVDWCACGTVWCYLCERVCPVSRAQAKAAEVVKAVEWIDMSSSLVSYGALGTEFDPPAPASASSTSSRPPVGQAIADGTAPADTAWAEGEMARVYWHEAPEYGPWRHTADWGRHVRSGRCAGDPLWAKRWPACPPSMADLGDLARCGFISPCAQALSSSSSSSSSSSTASSAPPTTVASAMARARAGRSNIERFHAIKRQRLTEEIVRCVDAVPWVDAEMIAAIRDWLPEPIWQRAVHSAGPAWRALCRPQDHPQQQQQQQSQQQQQRQQQQQQQGWMFGQSLRDPCAGTTPGNTQGDDLDAYPSWVSMLDSVPLGPLR